MMQEWFKTAKLGIFIHWGIYAVGRRGGESWPIVRGGKVSYRDYMSEMAGFDASAYDPKAWADLIEESGARYAVLTTKHHDGVTLWPTGEDSPSIPKEQGTGDLVGPYVEALRQKGIRAGLYFSHTDWSNMDHFSVITGMEDEAIEKGRGVITPWRELWEASFKSPDTVMPNGSHARWQAFLDFEKRQIKELLEGYGPVDLLWFDVMLHRPGYEYDCKGIRDHIHSISDTTIINSRLGEWGDYFTPEQFVPVYPGDGPWEVCMTTNDTWSFTGEEKAYKSVFEIVLMFCECLSMGGNFLLNVGPDEHGVIPDQQVSRLKALGAWIRKHEEAVYETKKGLPHGYCYGLTSLTEDEETIYLYLPNFPTNGTSLKGIRNDIRSISVVGHGGICSYDRKGGAPWINVPGVLWIHVPEEAADDHITVLKIELEGKLDLHGGEGVEIDVN